MKNLQSFHWEWLKSRSFTLEQAETTAKHIDRACRLSPLLGDERADTVVINSEDGSTLTINLAFTIALGPWTGIISEHFPPIIVHSTDTTVEVKPDRSTG